MIRPLRQFHRRVFGVLGIALPLALVAGLAARKPVPSVATLPTALAASPGQFTTVVWEREDLFVKSPVRVRALREPGTGRLGLTCSATRDFIKPDLLVYWVAGNPSGLAALPDSATLLGAFGTGVAPLPAEISGTTGTLILFSLADQEIVETAKPFTIAN